MTAAKWTLLINSDIWNYKYLAYLHYVHLQLKVTFSALIYNLVS